jgi:hypothetical protein
MKSKFTFAIAAVALYMWLGSAALSAATASASSAHPVHDGQKCSTARPHGAKWRVRHADGCRYLTGMGGAINLPDAATSEVEVFDRGHRLFQRRCGRDAWGFGPRSRFLPCGWVIWTTDVQPGRTDIVNGGPHAVRVYYFFS